MRLEKTNVGCYIGHEWYGGFGYADDMELQCPSIKELRTLVSTCTEFGGEYGITYNSIKSMCIAFCKGKARNVEEMPRIFGGASNVMGAESQISGYAHYL